MFTPEGVDHDETAVEGTEEINMRETLRSENDTKPMVGGENVAGD